MWNFLRHLFSGLRVRLLLLVMLASAPAVALTFYASWENRQRQAENWRQEALKIVQLTAREEDELIGGTRQLLRAVAESAEAPAWQWRSNTKKLLTRLLQDDPRYVNLGVINTNGEVVVSALPLPGPVNAADRPYFQRALYTHALSIGEYQIGRISRKPSINFGYPVLDREEQVQAVVFAALDLEWLNHSQYVLTRLLPEGTTWTKIDMNGTILVRQPEPGQFIGRPLAEAALLKTFLNRKNGELEAVDAHGDTIIYVFASTRSSLVAGDLISILSIPKNVLYAEADWIARRGLMLLGLVAVLIFVLGWIGSEVLVLRPLRTLVHSSARLARGEFSARTGLKHNEDELGQLTRTFDRMAQSLEQREADHQRAEQELRRSEERFRALVQNSADLIGITDAQGIVLYHSPNLQRTLGYEAADVIGQGMEKYLWPDDLPRYKARLAELVATPGQMARDEFRLAHRDGSCRFIECTLTNYLHDPAIGGIVFNCHNITERKEAGEKLAQYSHKLQLLSHRLVEAQETERRRIARELHDEIGQSLTVAQIHLQTQLRSPENGSRLAARLTDTLQVIERVLEQVQDISLKLRPSMLDDLGLESTLRWYSHRQASLTGLKCEVRMDPLEVRLEPVIETECFRVAQEALTNVARHAQARNVTVELRQVGRQLHLRVRDDGVGFAVAAVREQALRGDSLGLLNMEERASLAGGGLEFKSAPAQGTEVHAWFPLTWRNSQT